MEIGGKIREAFENEAKADRLVSLNGELTGWMGMDFDWPKIKRIGDGGTIFGLKLE